MDVGLGTYIFLLTFNMGDFSFKMDEMPNLMVCQLAASMSASTTTEPEAFSCAVIELQHKVPM